jgi:hypothetical protein
MEKFVVDGLGIIEEGADNALDALDASSGRRRADVWVWAELGLGSVDDWGGFEGRELAFFGKGMVVLE